MMKNRSSCDVAVFQERDIDMFLAEELRVNAEFSRWFVSRGGGAFPCCYPAFRTDVSVVADGSEADVAALFRDDRGRRYRLYVENKLTARKMPDQLERYVRRAENELARGEIHGWTVKLFAPASYSDRTCPEGCHFISLEDAANFLRHSADDPRTRYRADLLAAASVVRGQRERDAHTAETAPYVKEWWDAVYEMLESEFPGYFVHRTRYPRSVYFAPRTHGLPSDLLRIDFKGHKGEVDLAFKNCDYGQLVDVLRQIGEIPGSVVQNDKSVSIRISGLPRFTIADGKGIIQSRVRESYLATRKLIEFFKDNEPLLRTAFQTREEGESTE